jgi:hypothetical protein
MCLRFFDRRFLNRRFFNRRFFNRRFFNRRFFRNIGSSGSFNFEFTFHAM